MTDTDAEDSALFFDAEDDETILFDDDNIAEGGS